MVDSIYTKMALPLLLCFISWFRLLTDILEQRNLSLVAVLPIMHIMALATGRHSKVLLHCLINARYSARVELKQSTLGPLPKYTDLKNIRHV